MKAKTFDTVPYRTVPYRTVPYRSKNNYHENEKVVPKSVTEAHSDNDINGCYKSNSRYAVTETKF